MESNLSNCSEIDDNIISIKNSMSINRYEIIEILNRIFTKSDINFSIREDGMLSSIDRAFNDKIDISKICYNYKSFDEKVIELKNSCTKEKIITIGQKMLHDIKESYRIIEEGSELVFEGTKKVISSRNNNELVYYKIGSGKPILLINAFACCKDLWKEIIYLLRKEYCIYIFDVRGLEDCDYKFVDVFGVEEFVEDLHEIVLDAGIKKFSIISWCSGAKVAVKYASVYNKQVESICCIAGAFFPINELKEKYIEHDKNTIYYVAKSIQDAPFLANTMLGYFNFWEVKIMKVIY